MFEKLLRLKCGRKGAAEVALNLKPPIIITWSRWHASNNMRRTKETVQTGCPDLKVQGRYGGEALKPEN